MSKSILPNNLARVILCAALLLFVMLSNARAEQTRTITIEEAIQLALTNNLDIRINRYTPLLDQYALDILYSAYEPTLNLGAREDFNSSPGGVDPATDLPYPASTTTSDSYSTGISGKLPTGLTYNLGGTMTKTTGNDLGVNQIYSSGPGITLNQPILKNFWIDGNREQISLNRTGLKIDQLALRLQIMTVINNVKAAYFNLIFSRENVKVNIAAVKLAEQMLAENQQKVQLGSLAPLDAKQAESQAASSHADLLAAEQALSVQENVLKALISDHYGEWADTTPVPAETLLAVPENLDLQESLRRGVTQRPDLLEAKLTVEKQHITIKYTRNQLFPEVDLTGSYGQSAETLTFGNNLDTLRQGTYPFYSYGIVMTIPLGNKAARDNYKSAKAALEQTLLQLKKTEQTIVVAIDNDVKQVRSDLLRVDATRQASLYAESALEAEQTKLEQGKSTSFFVLQLQNNLTAARSAEIRALADYNIALEQLSFDEGSTLERNHIDIKMQ